MFPTERVLELLGVVVLIFLVPAGLLFFLCKTVWKGSVGKVMLVFSIVISSFGIALAVVGLAEATIFQGPSGEWAGLALLPAFIISLPAGMIALIISLIPTNWCPPPAKGFDRGIRFCDIVSIHRSLCGQEISNAFARVEVGLWRFTL